MRAKNTAAGVIVLLLLSTIIIGWFTYPRAEATRVEGQGTVVVPNAQDISLASRTAVAFGFSSGATPEACYQFVLSQTDKRVPDDTMVRWCIESEGGNTFAVVTPSESGTAWGIGLSCGFGSTHEDGIPANEQICTGLFEEHTGFWGAIGVKSQYMVEITLLSSGEYDFLLRRL